MVDDRRRLVEVERLPLRHPLEHVHEDDVAEVPLGEPVGRRGTDVSCPDHGDLGLLHQWPPRSRRVVRMFDQGSDAGHTIAPGEGNHNVGRPCTVQQMGV